MEITDLVFIDDTGYHFSDYPSFLAWLQGKYQSIYGADVYLEADSQDGQFLAILAKAFYDVAALGASTYNSFSPSTAQGIGLSRVVKINGLTRQAATNSTVDVTLTGTAGTVITNGIVQDILNQKWNLPTTVIIHSSGEVTVTATAQNPGAVTAESGTVTKIFTPTLGWQSVTNATAASIGQPAETDSALRQRQKISTSNPSLTVFDGTIGALENVTGVTDVQGYENDSGSTDGNGIPGHTICCVVDGGDVTEICQTIQIHKTPGVGTYGTTSEVVTDPKGMPLQINFFRPGKPEIGVEITLAVNDGWTSDYEAQIAAAVSSAINGNGIGNDVILTKLFAPAYLIGTPAYQTFDITLLRLKKDSGSFAAANVDILFNELAVCNPDTDFTFIIT